MRRVFLAALFTILLSVTPVHSILFQVSDDPLLHVQSSSPAWRCTGQFGLYTGTAISPCAFVTVKHIGGKVGDPFAYAGASFTTTESFDDPLSDLRVWHVKERLPWHASLYRAREEVGREVYLVGRGTRRGAEIYSGTRLLGWAWGESDHVQRWGVNWIRGLAQLSTGLGPVLTLGFEDGISLDMSGASAGDSGGGVFDSNVLLGVLVAVSHNGQALFTSQFYAIRISDRASWIDSVAARPRLEAVWSQESVTLKPLDAILGQQLIWQSSDDLITWQNVYTNRFWSLPFDRVTFPLTNKSGFYRLKL